MREMLFKTFSRHLSRSLGRASCSLISIGSPNIVNRNVLRSRSHRVCGVFPNKSFFSDICSLLVPGIRLHAVRPYLQFPEPPRTGYKRVQCLSFDALPVRIESGKLLPSQQRLKEIVSEAMPDPIAEIDAPMSTGTFEVILMLPSP